MMHLSKFFLISFCSLILTACGGEKAATDPVKEAMKPVTSKPSPTKAKPLNYCNNGEYNPKKPFKFVYFNLSAHKGVMSRIRDKVKVEMAKTKDLPREARAEAIAPYLAQTQVVAVLRIQPMADLILPVSATLCNFKIYEDTKCTGALSKSVLSAQLVDGVLTYTALDGKGQESTVTFKREDYSDMSIEARGGLSHWSRTADGVESFTFKDKVTETSWTENPDCSGQISQRRKNSSIEATWTSPKTGALRIDYNYCSKGKCFDGSL